MSNNCTCGAIHHPSAPAPAPISANYSEMQAVTTLLNPATVGLAVPKVQVYQSLPNGTLGYEQLDFTASQNLKPQEYGKVVGNYDNQPSPLSPPIRFGSNLVSLVIDGTVQIYGVSANTGSISLLSPVFQHLGAAKVESDLRGKIAGCSKDGKGWIYFQKSIGGGKYSIWEKSLTNLNAQPVELTDTDKSKQDTDIVAFHDGKRRWIVYQTASKERREDISQIQVMCLDDSNLNHIIDNSTTLTDNKLIELAATHAVKDGVQKVYIYFRGQGRKLFWSAAPNTPQGIRFSRPSPLAEETFLESHAALSVLPHKDGIVIYGIKDGNQALEAFLDPWDT